MAAWRIRRSGAPDHERGSDSPARTVLIPPRGHTYRDPMGLPAAYSCVRLLAHTAALMNVQTVTGDGQTEPPPRWLERAPALGDGLRLRDLVMASVTHMATNGAAVYYATPTALGWTLDLIEPSRVQVAYSTDRRRRVWHLDGDPTPTVLATPTARAGGLLVAGYLWTAERAAPLGPLQAAAQAVAGYLDADAFAGALFANGRATAVGAYLTSDLDLTPETADAWRAAWREQHADPTHDPLPILGNGLRLESIGLDPAAMQFLESRQYAGQEVARLFGVPPRYLGLPSGDASTYATARDNDAALLRYAVSPYTDAIAAAWSELLPDGRNASEAERLQFSADRLLAPTTTDRYAAHQTAIAAGFKTVAEVRAEEGLPPL